MAKATPSTTVVSTPFAVRLRTAKNGDNLLLIVTSKEATKTIAGVVGTVVQETLVYMSRQVAPFPTAWDGCKLTSDQFEAFKKEGV